MQKDATVATLLGKAQLCERLGISERTIENMVKARTFPPSVRIGKHVFWSEIVVSKWQKRMFADQESWFLQ